MPTEPMTKERLFDMVRHQRHALHTAELITDEEYAYLLTEGSGPNGSVHRLETYDEIRTRITAAEQRAETAEKALAEARRDTARLDWLQEEIVDTIYMDDGRIIDVRGEDMRKSMDVVMSMKGPAE